VTYNNNLISKVWPDKAVFVDWLDNNCLNLVVLGLDDLFNIFEFDGIWIDMNEATTFKDGEINPNPPTPPTEEAKSDIVKRCKSTFLIHFSV
jgi:alpha-glucosidase (family GH31 glycosyl hydrolase)